MLQQTNGRDFREIPGQRACNAKNNYSHKRTKDNLKNTFLPNTDKYSAVFTEYSVAEYSAGYYSAEYSADRIVGRSLALTKLTQTGATVQIRWIRGHNGSQGNETADLLANLGAASVANGPEPFLPYLTSYN
jgi:ribonuclease HI